MDDIARFRAAEEHFATKGSQIDREIWAHAKKRNMRARIITDDAGDPYLLRLYLTPHKDDELGKETKPRVLPAVFLHYFFRGDHDRELHNHPWKWALSLILTKGYTEERLTRGAGIIAADLHYKRRVRPGALNLIRQNDYHRVLLDRGSCWTLFIAGPKVPAVRGEDWGFLEEGGGYVSWGERERIKGIDRGNGPQIELEE